MVGCGSTNQTVERSAVTGAASAAGIGLAEIVAPNSNIAKVAGGAGGALLSTLALGEDKTVYDRGYQEGKEQGESDSAKRHYWMQQDGQSSHVGKQVYYTFPAPPAKDGTKEVPHKITVPVVE